MKAWEDWAIIVGEDVVNVCCFSIGGYTEAQWMAHEQYGPDAFAVEVTQIMAGIGSKYRDGQFWIFDKDGNEVEATILPTAEETAQANSDAIDEILISMLEM